MSISPLPSPPGANEGDDASSCTRPPSLSEDSENSSLGDLNLSDGLSSPCETLSVVDEEDNSDSDNTTKRGQKRSSSSGALVKVFLRLRPHGKAGSDNAILEPCDDDTLVMQNETTVQTIAPQESQSFKNRETGGKFSFTKVFNKATTQRELFESTTESLVDGLLRGKDGLLFAYGVTNAGKTYTVEGDKENPGIIPHTLQYIFTLIEQMQAERPEFSAKVDVSYLQVYNEQVHDLQAVSKRSGGLRREKLKIKLREEGVEVLGLKTTEIGSCRAGLDVLARGREVRATHETQCNLKSSRSHSVFVIQLGKRGSTSKPARLYIVDLAGSERAKRTLTSRARQREASNINCSLMNLMRCLDTLRLNQKNKRLNRPEQVVPFRQSKLTLLFRDCFVGGNCGGVAMIVNASARPDDYDETAHALKYGALVKNVRVARMQTNQRNSIAQYGFNGRRLRSASKAAAALVGCHAKATTPSKKGLTYKVEEDFSPLSPKDHPIISALVYELADARMKCVSMEAEIRQEVAQEMSERLVEMEERFRKRMDTVQQISDSKSEALTENIRKRMQDGNSSLYSMEDVESLVKSISECEEEMESMRKRHVADVTKLREQLQTATQAAESKASESSQKKHRESFERLDRAVVEQLEALARVKDELIEEKSMHEKTTKQLESATQLAKDAQAGEAQAERMIMRLRYELDEANQKLASKTKNSRLAPPRLPLRAALSRGRAAQDIQLSSASYGRTARSQSTVVTRNDAWMVPQQRAVASQSVCGPPQVQTSGTATVMRSPRSAVVSRQVVPMTAGSPKSAPVMPRATASQSVCVLPSNYKVNLPTYNSNNENSQTRLNKENGPKFDANSYASWKAAHANPSKPSLVSRMVGRMRTKTFM